MKKIHINTVKGALCLMMFFFLPACSDFLEEQPRSIYEPGYFKTEKGIQGGLTALYAHLRDIYGQGYHYNAAETGTDEYTWGRNANSNFKDADLSGVGSLTASTSRSDVVWNATYPYINTANGIIENASAAGMSEALIAEAQFFRAFDYFLLVQTFGGVPLDLGSGELAFNTSTIRISKRNTVPEVYTKAIFPDFKAALANLPDKGRITGGATKTAARLYLAKAYLTYGWWLENPNNIPTYPETARTDPDGHDAAWYFQQAYNMSLEGINGAGSNFGLQPTFYDVNLATNDRNKEIILYADRTESSEFYNGASLSYHTGEAPGNFAQWMVQWQYELINSSKNPNWTELVKSVQREASQDFGRPWTSMAPPIKVFTETFADKVYDSRYDGTFTTVLRGNWDKVASLRGSVFYNANGLEVRAGDPILTFLDEEPSGTIDYSNKPYDSGVGAGVLSGRADFVVSPLGISRHIYPGLWKLGPYRTDNGDGLGQPNGGITRPFPVAKFSEFYLIAAEAAVKGAALQAGMSARELVNVLRARAGVWRWNHNGNTAKTDNCSKALTDATPQNITIDYILAERSREFFGEGYRWYDLVRTQKWTELASAYEICGTAVGDHTLVRYTRTIQAFHYLRPIPSGQLDGMEMTDAEKKAYQNPGY